MISKSYIICKSDGVTDGVNEGVTEGSNEGINYLTY
jgi:hypothetical protein